MSIERNPLIGTVSEADTLYNVAGVLAVLRHLDTKEGTDDHFDFGLFKTLEVCEYALRAGIEQHREHRARNQQAEATLAQMLNAIGPDREIRRRAREAVEQARESLRQARAANEAGNRGGVELGIDAAIHHLVVTLALYPDSNGCN